MMALLLFALGGTLVYGQAMEPISNQNQFSPFADVSPTINGNAGPSTNGIAALWDVQFVYNATDTAMGDVGMAACNFAFGEFWVSRWASDTLYRFSSAGSLISEFVISGLSGTRSITADANFLYAGTAGTTIYRINPTTRTLAPPHINTSFTGGIRHCTFDPTLDNGNGGFWVGNFGTDISPISMAGVTLSGTIPSATHGLGGMYGSAFDGISAGGPYLWVFHQGGNNNSEITRLQLPGGAPTLVTHDAMSDAGVLAGLSSGLAGGLFISDQLVPGKRTLGGMIQGTPSNTIFGYELSDPVIASADAELSDMRPTKGYTQIPVNHVFGETFDLNLGNVGTDPLDTVFVDFDVVFNASTSVFTNTQMTMNLASAGTVVISSAPFTPSNGIGTYEVTATARLGANQNDTVASNNVNVFTFEVTDSTFARDDNTPDGGNGYAVSNTDWAYAMSNYTLTVDDTLSSIWINLATPVDGDTTYAVVANTVGGTPNAVLVLGTVQIISASTNDYVLNIPGGLPMTAGTYSFGCYEQTGSTINLAQSNNVFTAGSNFFFTGSGGWSPSSIPTARFIRPNFGTPTAVGIDDLKNTVVNVYPNPSNGSFSVVLGENINADMRITVLNPVGQEVAQKVINPSVQNKVEFALEGQASGIYFIRVEGNEQSVVKKLMLTK